MTNDPHAVVCLGNVYTYVAGNIPDELKKAIQDKVHYILPGAKYISEYQEKKRGLAPRVEDDSDPDGKKKFWDGTCTCARPWNIRNSDGSRCNGLVLPTGLYSMLREVLTDNNIPYTLEDQRQPTVTTPGWSTEGFTLRDYQQPEEEKMLNRQRGVMKMATGGGKTHLMCSTMVKAAAFPATFYVPSCDLLEQTYDVFSKHVRYNGQPVEIGRIGDGHCDIRNITIATIQSCQMALEGRFDKFDDESPDDETEFSENQKKDIAALVKSTQFAYCDECFGYHSMVLMPDGSKERIGKLVNTKYSGEVASWNEKKRKFENNKVIGWIRKKTAYPIIRVETGNIGGTTCTDNHVFYTLRGEVESRHLKRGDGLLAHLSDKRAVPALSEDGKQVAIGTSLGDGCILLGCRESIGARLSFTHCVEQRGYLDYKMSFFGKLGAGVRPTTSGYTGEMEWQGVTRSSVELSRIMETPKADRIKELDWLGLSMLFLDDGSLDQRQGSGSIAACAWGKDALNEIIKKLNSMGFLASVMPTKKGPNIYIPRRSMEIFGKYLAQYTPPCLRYKVPLQFRNECKLYEPQPVPEYGWIPVRGIRPASLSKQWQYTQEVYCLTVENNHNFITNGSVVRNCQHTSCKTIQAIFNNSNAARFRVGGSASPWRDDGLDMLIEACFGRKFCDITASFLIHNGYLVRPHIVFNHFSQFLGKAAKYQSAYSKYVVENDVRNRWVAERAAYHVKEGRPTIILVKWSKHAEILQELLPDAEVLTSSGKLKRTPEKRKEVLNRMRERNLMCIIGTTLLDEGVDLPAANVGIFAGGGKSSTRALQRTGRIIRKDENDPGKDIAYIEEFYDHTKWLDHHARARIKILSTEPEFQISNNRATMNL